MFLAAIVKEHAASAGAVEPISAGISHDETTVIEVTGVVAVPDDFLGVPAAEPRQKGVPASRSRWV